MWARQLVGDERTLTRSLTRLGNAALDQGDYARARLMLEEGRALAKRLGDRSALAWATHSLAWVTLEEGDDDQARSLYEESIDVWRELGVTGAIANAVCDLGFVALHQDRYREAHSHFGESLGGSREVGWTETVACCFVGLAAVAASEGAEEPATRLLGAARAARDSVGTRFPANVLEFEERAANSARAKLGDKRFAAALRHGEEMSLDDAIAYALGDADN